MKRFSLPIALSVMAFLFTGTSASAAEVTSRLSANVSDQGQLTVETGYLTNYVFRGVNPQTGAEGPLRILRRNKKALTLPADIQWDGLIPDIMIDFPEFNTETTTINLANYPYPGSTSFENSDLVFRGANLLDLVTDFPDTKGEQIDALTLFLLNSLSLAEVTGEIAGNTDSLFDTNISEKIAPLAEFIADYQSSLQEAEDIVVLVEILLSQQRQLLSAVGVESNSIPELQSTLDNLNSFLSALDDIGVVVQVSDEVRAARTGTLAKQYEKLVENASSLSTEEILQAAVTEFSRRYSETESSEARANLVFQFVINPAGDVFEILENEQQRELQRLNQTQAGEAIIERQENKILLTERAFAVTQIAKLLFSDIDFVQLAKDDPGQIVEPVFAIGYTLRKELLTTDNAEIVTKRVIQLATGKDGRETAFEAIRAASDNANAYMRALQLGGDIGNKAIPFLWDLILGPNYLRSSIIDGEINSYGWPETLVSVDRLEANGSATKFSYSNISDGGTETVLADPGDIIDISAFLSRPLLFAEDRAPWKVNQSQIPVTVYSVGIVTPDRFEEKTLCVRKILGNTDFSLQTVDQPDFSASVSECGEGTLRGGDAYRAIPARRVVYNDPASLPREFTLQNDLAEAITPIEAQRYVVKGEDDEKFSVIYHNFSGPNFTQTFSIQPASSNASIDIDTDEITNGMLRVIAQLSAVPDEEVVSSVTWDWGDGSTDAVSSPAPFSHVYEEEGTYTVSVVVLFESGRRFLARSDVIVRVGVPTQPPGTQLAVAGDGFVRLNWNGVEGAISYNIYSSTETLGQPPDFENYAAYANGNVIQNINSISSTVEDLTNGITYFFVVTASMENGSEDVVAVISIAPSKPPIICDTEPTIEAHTLVSADINGIAANDVTSGAAITENGRFVAFGSRATNLVSGSGDTSSGLFRVYLKDLETGAVTLPINAIDEGQPDNSLIPLAFSENGRFLFITGRASNLISDDNNGRNDIFRFDLSTGDILRVNETADGIEDRLGGGYLGSSNDGRFVTFQSRGLDQTGNSFVRVYTKDLDTLALDLLVERTNSFSVTSGPTVYGFSNRTSNDRVRSAYVTDQKLSPLDVDNTVQVFDVYVRDQNAQTDIFVSLDENEEPTLIGQGPNGIMKSDGSRVLFNASSSRGNSLFIRDIDAAKSCVVVQADFSIRSFTATRNLDHITYIDRASDGRELLYLSSAYKN